MKAHTILICALYSTKYGILLVAKKFHSTSPRWVSCNFRTNNKIELVRIYLESEFFNVKICEILWSNLVFFFFFQNWNFEFWETARNNVLPLLTNVHTTLKRVKLKMCKSCCHTTFSITILSTTTLRTMTQSTITLRILLLCIMKLWIMRRSVMAFSTTTLNQQT
jgi:hypothetical protein